MADTKQLDGRTEVTFDDGTTLIAPDLIGEVEEMSLQESHTRSGGVAQDPALLAAFEGQGMQVAKVLELNIQDDISPVGPAGIRRSSSSPGQTRLGEEAISLQVPAIKANEAAVAMYTDEEGCIRWIFPEAREDARSATRGAGENYHFLLPRESAPAPPPATARPTRGTGTQLARRVVRVITWITDPIIGAGLEVAVRKWEEPNRPYGLRAFPFMPGAGEPDWSTIAEGRALCFIHGTFSSCHASYSVFSSETIGELEQLYDKRIFGFDHPSLHHGPAENIETLFSMLSERLPAGSALELDVVTHSRGGLVLRTLDQAIRDGKTNGLKVSIRRAILVASPNRGTVLTTGDHGIDMIDRYTNLIAKLPDNVFTYLFEGLLTLVKLSYHAGVNTLPGLMSMQPEGVFLGALNAKPLGNEPTPEYYAIAANYAPKPGDGLGGVFKRIGNKVVDTCFEEENDLVVPTLGSSRRRDTEEWISPARLLKLVEVEAIHHCNYFGSPKVAQQILQWLKV
jgi:hypothetical protein